MRTFDLETGEYVPVGRTLKCYLVLGMKWYAQKIRIENSSLSQQVKEIVRKPEKTKSYLREKGEKISLE